MSADSTLQDFEALKQALWRVIEVFFTKYIWCMLYGLDISEKRAMFVRNIHEESFHVGGK